MPWGYSFRLGSAQAWFQEEADDARAWLIGRGILEPTGVLARNYPERLAWRATAAAAAAAAAASPRYRQSFTRS